VRWAFAAPPILDALTAEATNSPSVGFEFLNLSPSDDYCQCPETHMYPPAVGCQRPGTRTEVVAGVRTHAPGSPSGDFALRCGQSGVRYGRPATGGTGNHQSTMAPDFEAVILFRHRIVQKLCQHRAPSQSRRPGSSVPTESLAGLNSHCDRFAERPAAQPYNPSLPNFHRLAGFR
jgi:hypothetical protein